ncbi:MAG TPA: hypothetical protein V6D14_32770 [Coleofasciculaceae cyanobacterium]|jgi:hypothetical protein
MIKTPSVYDSGCIEQVQKVVAEAITHFANMDIKDWEFLAAMAEISHKQGNHQKAQAWRAAAHLVHHFAVTDK